MNYLTDRELLEDVINDVDLSNVDVSDVCWDYGVNLIVDAGYKRVHRTPVRRIIADTVSSDHDILLELVYILRKMYDEEDILVSLKRSIKRHGSL